MGYLKLEVQIKKSKTWINVLIIFSACNIVLSSTKDKAFTIVGFWKILQSMFNNCYACNLNSWSLKSYFVSIKSKNSNNIYICTWKTISPPPLISPFWHLTSDFASDLEKMFKMDFSALQWLSGLYSMLANHCTSHPLGSNSIHDRKFVSTLDEGQ